MFKRVRNLLDSAVSLVRARRADKGDRAEAKPSNRVGGSTFEIGELPGCYAGSFNAVFLRLLDWATSEPAPLLLLTGPARCGKSAVARSLVTHWESEGRLAVRLGGSIKSLIPALARQIAHAIPELQSQTRNIIADNQQIWSQQSFQAQFEDLIVKPILQLKVSPARRRASFPISIVLDSLDECDDRTERDLFLESIFKVSPRLQRYLKFLIVSRPESDIQDLFESTRFQDKATVIDLSPYRNNAGAEEANGSGLTRPLDNSDRDMDNFFHTVLSSSRTSRTTIVNLLSVVLVCLQVDGSPLTPFNDIPTSLTQSDRFMESILDLEPRSLPGSSSDLRALINFRRKLMLEGRPFEDARLAEFCHKSLKDFLIDESGSGEFYVDLKASYLTVAKSMLRILSDKGSVERYWTDEGPESGFDVRLVYHNCLVWCYERLMPDGDLQSVMMAYDPIDYLSSRRESISDPSAVALFTFACRFLGRFAEIPSCTNISDRLGGCLDRYLKLEIDYWAPQNSKLMRILKGCIFPDHIDWELFRAFEEVLQTDREAILKRVHDPRAVEEHLPYFLTWMFDKGLGYAGSTVERTVCDFFYSEARSGKYYFGQRCN